MTIVAVTGVSATASVGSVAVQNASRSLSLNILPELVRPMTQVGFLLEITFSGVNVGDADEVVRRSTYGTVTWNSYPWPGANLVIGGFSADGKSASATIADDASATWRTLCMRGAGPRNRKVRIWKVYINALGTTDPAQFFEGVTDGVAIRQGVVNLSFARLNVGVMFAPRQRINAANGFNFLAAKGSVISWGNQQITLG